MLTRPAPAFRRWRGNRLAYQTLLDHRLAAAAGCRRCRARRRSAHGLAASPRIGAPPALRCGQRPRSVRPLGRRQTGGPDVAARRSPASDPEAASDIRSAAVFGFQHFTPSFASVRRTRSGPSPAVPSACRSSARRPWETDQTSLRPTPRSRTTPMGCSVRETLASNGSRCSAAGTQKSPMSEEIRVGADNPRQPLS
jgi:hypothetical protein